MYDGTATRVYNLAKAASSFSKRVYLVAPSINDHLRTIKNLVWIRMRPFRRSMLLAFSGLMMASIIRALLKIMMDIESLKEVDIDLIHVHWFTNIPIAIAIRDYIDVKLPIVVDVHGSFALQFPRPGNFGDISTIYLGRVYEYLAVKKREIAGITVPSDAFRRYLIERYRLSSDYVYTVPDAFDLSLVEKSLNIANHKVASPKGFRCFDAKGSKIIGYVGATSFYHGFLDLLQAFAIVKKEVPDVKLMLIVPRADEVWNLAKRSGIRSEDMIIIENIPRSLVISYLKLANVLVLPHRAGTQFEYLYSNKVFDYVLSGRPIVAYSLHSIKEFLKEYPCKIFVKPNKPAELAKGIISALLKMRNVEIFEDIRGLTIPTLNDVSRALKEAYQAIIQRSIE